MTRAATRKLPKFPHRLWGPVAALLLVISATLADATVFDCVSEYYIDSFETSFRLTGQKIRKTYTVDSRSGMVVDASKSWPFRVTQARDAVKGKDWVLVYLRELMGPYLSAEDVLKQIHGSAIFSISVWKKGNPFLLDWAGVIELGALLRASMN